MSINAFDAAVAGESVLVTETRMEELQLLGRVGSTSFVISGSRRNFSPESLNPYELLGAALGSSTAMTLRLYADRMGWPLVRIQVSVSHHPSGEDCGAAFERSIILEGDLSAGATAAAPRRRPPLPGRPDTQPGRGDPYVGQHGHCISAAPATSDYLRDIEERVGALQETFSHVE